MPPQHCYCLAGGRKTHCTIYAHCYQSYIYIQIYVNDDMTYNTIELLRQSTLNKIQSQHITTFLRCFQYTVISISLQLRNVSCQPCIYHFLISKNVPARDPRSQQNIRDNCLKSQVKKGCQIPFVLGRYHNLYILMEASILILHNSIKHIFLL